MKGKKKEAYKRLEELLNQYETGTAYHTGLWQLTSDEMNRLYYFLKEHLKEKENEHDSNL